MRWLSLEYCFVLDILHIKALFDFAKCPSTQRNILKAKHFQTHPKRLAAIALVALDQAVEERSLA